MKNLILTIVIAFAIMFSACNNKKAENIEGIHEVVVKEVLQANAYTYMNVTENEKEQWIAVTKIDAKIGETYYFKDFMEMEYFESKDLGRAFESIYFVERISKSVEDLQNIGQLNMPAGHPTTAMHEGKPNLEKEDINIEPAEGGISIAELYSNKAEYEEKKVIIRGKLVKANMGIMNKNWYHIQDGTSIDGKFDLTITSAESWNVTDIITIEGIVAINKDFGHGYKYELIVEEGKKK